ncbi:TIGR04283 family arsenosugar biosynthesis glycosyltransferase [bacterium]|nr:TIGR04283 family arsenosugar biosynthesis glycosyltransferase [bacterium]
MTESGIPLTIVIPTFNEALNIRGFLQKLQPLRAQGCEIILADGDSEDGTPIIAKMWVDQVVVAPKGRAQQMNAGALRARGNKLLFLHADTSLPSNIIDWLKWFVVQPEQSWGFFCVRLSGKSVAFRVIEKCINVRSRLTAVATGDQAIYVGRDQFRALGGFDDIPLMEDVSLSKTLKKISPPTIWDSPVITDSRRWEKRGTVATVLLMWKLRLMYWLGVSPNYLAKKYYGR